MVRIAVSVLIALALLGEAHQDGQLDATHQPHLDSAYNPIFEVLQRLLWWLERHWPWRRPDDPTPSPWYPSTPAPWPEWTTTSWDPWYPNGSSYTPSSGPWYPPTPAPWPWTTSAHVPHCDWPTERSFRYQSYLQEATGLVKQNGQEAGLTEEELVAIFGWTCTDYEFIKPISWGDDEVNSYFSNAHTYCTLHRADVWPEIEVLLGALNKLPPSKPFNETLWRGWRKETPEELGRMITGGPGGFFSASRNFDVSLGFAGPTLWAIESHISGKHISDFSAFPSEDEILFPLGNRMEVVECSPTTFSNTMLQKIDERKRYSNLTVVCVKEVPAQFKTVMKEAPAQSETVMSGAPSHSQTLVV